MMLVIVVMVVMVVVVVVVEVGVEVVKVAVSVVLVVKEINTKTCQAWPRSPAPLKAVDTAAAAAVRGRRQGEKSLQHCQALVRMQKSFIKTHIMSAPPSTPHRPAQLCPVTHHLTPDNIFLVYFKLSTCLCVTQLHR